MVFSRATVVSCGCLRVPVSAMHVIVVARRLRKRCTFLRSNSSATSVCARARRSRRLRISCRRIPRCVGRVSALFSGSSTHICCCLRVCVALHCCCVARHCIRAAQLSAVVYTKGQRRAVDESCCANGRCVGAGSWKDHSRRAHHQGRSCQRKGLVRCDQDQSSTQNIHCLVDNSSGMNRVEFKILFVKLQCQIVCRVDHFVECISFGFILCLATCGSSVVVVEDVVEHSQIVDAGNCVEFDFFKRQ